MSHKHERYKQLPMVPQDTSPPALRAFLIAVKEQLETLAGQGALKDKRPTVQEMIDAGVTNAEEIE